MVPQFSCVSDDAEEQHAKGKMTYWVDPWYGLSDHGMVVSWREFWMLRVKKKQEAARGA